MPVYFKPGIMLILSQCSNMSSALVGWVRDLRCGQQPRFAPTDRHRVIERALVYCPNLG
jgi:hypothetical protein